MTMSLCLYIYTRLVCIFQLSEELDKVDEKLKAAEDLLESKVSIPDVTRCRRCFILVLCWDISGGLQH